MRRVQALVIGAGPGGYVAAIRLGQLGKRVLLVERDAPGGECLNYGCIPSKAMISAASLAHKAGKAKEIGLDVQGLSVDMDKMQDWRAKLIQGLQRGIATLSKGSGAEVLAGEALLTGPHSAEVRAVHGTESVEFEHCILATGSRPMELPGFKIDGNHVLGSKEALELRRIPPRLLILGGGVIGVEIGTYYAKLGSRVTVVEMLPRLLAGLEPELAQPVSRQLSRLGVETLLRSKASGWQTAGDGVEATVATPDGERRIAVDKILLSAGRAPNSSGLGLEAAGVKGRPDGTLAVNDRLQTNVPHIYAVGDVSGPPFLAHKASREGILAARSIAGLGPEPIGEVPWAVFTDPEIAFVGMTDAQAGERGLETTQGRFPFSASGRARTAREPEGFVKVLAEKGSGKILGVGIVGPSACELISEACLALRMGATLEDVASTIHPHPTLPEAFQEACEAALGRAIHVIAPAGK